MLNRRRWSVGLALVLSLSLPLAAKGPTVRIEIAGLGLAGPVQVTSPALVEQFQVWAGPGTSVNGQESPEGFIIDWATGGAAGRAAGLPRYRVSFFTKSANRRLESQPEHQAYCVWYAPDFDSGRGYVYLPGKGDEAFLLTAGTIVRGREALWFRATEAWNQAVLGRLRASS